MAFAVVHSWTTDPALTEAGYPRFVPGGTSATPRLVFASPDAPFGPFTNDEVRHALPRTITASLTSPCRATVARLRVAAELFIAGRASGAPLAPLRAQLESLVTGYARPPPRAARFADRQRRRTEERLLLLAPSLTGHELTLLGALRLNSMPEHEFQNFAASLDSPPSSGEEPSGDESGFSDDAASEDPSSAEGDGPVPLGTFGQLPPQLSTAVDSTLAAVVDSARLLLLPRPATERLEVVAGLLRSLAGWIDSSASAAPSRPPSDSGSVP